MQSVISCVLCTSWNKRQALLRMSKKARKIQIGNRFRRYGRQLVEMVDTYGSQPWALPVSRPFSLQHGFVPRTWFYGIATSTGITGLPFYSKCHQLFSRRGCSKRNASSSCWGRRRSYRWLRRRSDCQTRRHVCWIVLFGWIYWDRDEWKELYWCGRMDGTWSIPSHAWCLRRARNKVILGEYVWRWRRETLDQGNDASFDGVEVWDHWTCCLCVCVCVGEISNVTVMESGLLLL